MAGNRSLGSLTLDMVVKFGAWAAGLDQAERKMKSSTTKISGLAKGLGTALGLSFAGIATGIVASLNSAIDRMDELRDASIRLGVGTETLSAFGYAAQQTGTDIDSLGKAFKILSKNIADASEGKGKAPIFAALGISVKDAQGNLKQLEQIIPEIADAFSQLEDGTQKAALAQELFGKSGLELTEFLNSGSAGLKEFTDRARELGLVVSQDAADSADKFNDNLADLKGAITGLATEIATPLLPALADMIRSITDWIREGDTAKTIADELSGAFQALSESASFLWNVFDTGAMTLKGVAYDLAAVYKLAEAGNKLRLFDVQGAQEAFDQAKAFRKEAAAASDQIEKDWTDFNNKFGNGGKPKATGPALPQMFQIPGIDQQRQQFSAVPLVSPKSANPFPRLAGALGGNTGAGGAGKKGGGGGSSRAAELTEEQKAAQQLEEAYKRLNESYAEQIALFGKTTEEAQVRYDTEFGDLKNLSEAKKEELILNAQRIDQMKAEKAVQDDLDQINKRKADTTADILADIEFQNSLLGKTAEEQDTLNKLRYAGVSANDAYGQSIISANKALHENAQATADQIAVMDEFRSGLADAFGDFITGAKSAKEAFTDFADNFVAQVLRMIAQKWIERAFGQQGTTGGGSGWGAILQAGASALFGGGRAAGGPVMPGMLYRVNENKPEVVSFDGRDYLMTGGKQGVVKPDKPAVVRQGDTNVYHFNFRGDDIQRSAAQAAAVRDYLQRVVRMRNGTR